MQARTARPTHWIQPPGDLAKLNVDAAIGGSSSVGVVAAVCRDREGLYLGHQPLFLGASPTILHWKHSSLENQWH